MNKRVSSLILSCVLIVQMSSGILTFADEKTLDNESGNSNVTSSSKVTEDNSKKEVSSKTDSTGEVKKDNTEKKNSDSVSSEEKTGSDSEKKNESKQEENSEKIEKQPRELEEAVKTEADKFIEGSEILKNISGEDRVQTSIEISRFENEKSEKVIIADASKYPDALSASNLTDGKYPILLVNKYLSSNLKKEIERLNASEVIILGGKNSVPSSVENSLKNISSVKNVKRIAGVDRYDTCNGIFKSAGKNSIVFASGENFPDALASSTLLKNAGLLFVKKNSVPFSLRDTVKNIENKDVEVVGGYSSVGKYFDTELTNRYGIESVKRISGENRYSTSVKIAEKTETDIAIVASGKSFPDALAASTLSQKLKAPVLLVSKDTIDDSVIDYIKTNKIRKIVVLGGNNSISENTKNNIKRLLEGKDVVNNKNVTENTSGNSSGNSLTEAGKPAVVGKSAITAHDVQLYSDPDFTNKIGSLPAKKVVTLMTEDNNAARIDYYGTLGWVNKDELVNYDPRYIGVKVNHVPYISQLYPVYAPNGCEPTSLLMGLKGKGYTNIGLREFLDKMPKTNSNPKYGYVGVPYNVEQGRFQTIDPEPLAKYGRKYGNVVNIQGSSLEDIIKELQNGNTVVAYETLFWNKAYYKTLPIDGVPTRRIWNNHVLLLTGYDPFKKMFYIADPYNHEKMGASRKKPFYYWRSYADVSRCYNYDNRRFAVSVR